jgi:hypothetical protein
MGIFSDGTIASPERRWKQVLDFWILELRTSAQRYAIGASHGNATEESRITKSLEKKLAESESFMKASMAVSASARCVEVSGGAAEVYLSYLVPGGEGGPNMDLSDTWNDILIHGNPEAYNKVIDDDLVRYYYDKLLSDAGITNVHEPERIKDKKTGKNKGEKMSTFDIDMDAAENGTLILYLQNSAQEGGLSGWVNYTLNHDSSVPPSADRKLQEAAAKLAADAFLIDKFSRWSYQFINAVKKDVGYIYPSPNFGGDPLRSTLDPKFLPSQIKGMYGKEEDKFVMGLFNMAFRPDDVVMGDQLIPATMLGDLKGFGRYNKALYAILAKSRAQGLADFSPKTLQEILPEAIDLLDQIYGRKKFKNSSGTGEISGKELVGIMMARILNCKATALTKDVVPPSAFDATIGKVLSTPDIRDLPNSESLQFLLGRDLKGRTGFLAKVMGGRMRLEIRDEAHEILQSAVSKLQNQDPREGWRKLSELFSLLGFLLNASYISTEAVLASQGISVGGGKR